MGSAFEPDTLPGLTTNQFVVQNDVITSALFAVQDSGAPEFFMQGQAADYLDFLTGGVINSAPPDVVDIFATPVSPIGYYGTATYSLVTSEPSTFLLTFFVLVAGAIYRLVDATRLRNSAAQNPY